jgi:hypothetical protein
MELLGPVLIAVAFGSAAGAVVAWFVLRNRVEERERADTLTREKLDGAERRGRGDFRARPRPGGNAGGASPGTRRGSIKAHRVGNAARGRTQGRGRTARSSERRPGEAHRCIQCALRRGPAKQQPGFPGSRHDETGRVPVATKSCSRHWPLRKDGCSRVTPLPTSTGGLRARGCAHGPRPCTSATC